MESGLARSRALLTREHAGPWKPDHASAFTVKGMCAPSQATCASFRAWHILSTNKWELKKENPDGPRYDRPWGSTVSILLFPC